MSAVEKYYSVAECALLLSCSDKTVVRKMDAGEFGAECVNIGTEKRPDYRIPASGLNGYLRARRIFCDLEPGIAARSVGELRRKDLARRAKSTDPV